MKKMMLLLAIFAMSMAFGLTAHAAAREGYVPVAEAAFDHLTITSFSEWWDEEALNGLYEELLLNFHSDEFALLSDIYLYPDSPEGVSGLYYEDVSYQGGKLSFGNQAYIELFSMDKRRTAADAAPVLAHEYGHHYTIVNITAAEKLYWSEWGKSRYGTLRGLADAPLGSSYLWDVTEIAAWDYVQLLASPNARRGYDYPDAAERLSAGSSYNLSPTMFNKRPQDNAALPLAAQVDGLYAYLLGVGGYTAAPPSIGKAPVIIGVAEEESFLNPKYTLTWSPAEGAGVYTYTAVMFPADYPFLLEPLKTVSGDEPLSAVFGTVTETLDSGETAAVLDYYAGDYIFVIYAQDENGYIFASAPVLYSFGHDYFDTLAYLPPAAEDESTTVETAPPVKAAPPSAPVVKESAPDVENTPLAIEETAPAVKEAKVFTNPVRTKQKLKLTFSRASADISVRPCAAVKPSVPAHVPKPIARRERGITITLSRRAYNGFRLSHSYGKQIRF